MNEKTVLKSSLYVFAIGCGIFVMVSFIIHDISYILGFILGYIINVIVFRLIMKMCEEILKMSQSTILIIIGFVLKLALYALGFFIAVKSDWFHIIGVFFGYFVTKIAIYLEGFIHKGGEVDG